MNRIIRRRVALFVATLITMVLGAVGLAQSASAATYDEIFPCTGSTSSGTWGGVCKGTWYAGTPDVRTAGMYLDLVTISDAGYRNTQVKTVSSTDGRKKIYQWRCQNDDGTTSSLLSTTTVGGGLANSYTWAGGYNPCAGYRGLHASIVATYGNYSYTTEVQINAPKTYYPHAWRGYQRTA